MLPNLMVLLALLAPPSIAQACAMLKTRAQFQPALGPDGKPAKDAITSRIIWKIAG